jgi:hypothetical protein
VGGDYWANEGADLEEQKKVRREIAELKYQEALKQIDQEWEAQRKKFFFYSKDFPQGIPPAETVPPPVQRVGGAVFCLILGIFIIIIGSRVPSPGPFFAWIIGLYCITGGMYALLNPNYISPYIEAKNRYLERRGRIRKEDFYSHEQL